MNVRLRFSKLGRIRFTSHRDIARIWERSLRKVSLPVARSQGFHPRPKLHFGLALSTGYESLAEYIDVDFIPEAEIDVSKLPGLLTPALPSGFSVLAAAELPSGTPSLQHAVTCCRWDVEIDALDPETLRSKVESLMAQPELMMTRQRKGKDVTDDVRPHLHSIRSIDDSQSRLIADLGVLDRGLRPSELAELLGVDGLSARACRIQQFTELDGQPVEVLPLPLDIPSPSWEPGTTATTGAVLAPHAQMRAS